MLNRFIQSAVFRDIARLDGQNILKFSSSSAKQSLVSFKNTEKRIGYLTLSNSKKRNPLSEQTLSQLRDVLTKIQKSYKNQENFAKVVILNAQGPVFSAGHDLKQFQKSSSEKHEKIFSLCSQVMLKIRKLPQPVIASVNGLATAAGLQLATSCDMIVATESSKFQCPGVQIGLFCTTPGIALIRAINSRQKAFEMLVTGEPISAQEAFQYGIVNYLVPNQKDLEKECTALAEQITHHSADTIALGQEAFYKQIEIQDLSQAYDFGCQIMTDNLKQEDCQQGIKSFVEQRHPQFKY